MTCSALKLFTSLDDLMRYLASLISRFMWNAFLCLPFIHIMKLADSPSVRSDRTTSSMNLIGSNAREKVAQIFLAAKRFDFWNQTNYSYAVGVNVDTPLITIKISLVKISYAVSRRVARYYQIICLQSSGDLCLIFCGKSTDHPFVLGDGIFGVGLKSRSGVFKVIHRDFIIKLLLETSLIIMWKALQLESEHEHMRMGSSRIVLSFKRVVLDERDSGCYLNLLGVGFWWFLDYHDTASLLPGATFNE